MKKAVIPSWFGEITAEEIEAIRRQTETYDNMVTRFQKRPRTDSETEEKQ